MLLRDVEARYADLDGRLAVNGAPPLATFSARRAMNLAYSVRLAELDDLIRLAVTSGDQDALDEAHQVKRDWLAILDMTIAEFTEWEQAQHDDTVRTLDALGALDD